MMCLKTVKLDNTEEEFRDFYEWNMLLFLKNTRFYMLLFKNAARERSRESQVWQ